MAGEPERVRRVFSIQEERKKQFMQLEKLEDKNFTKIIPFFYHRVQQEYMSGDWTQEQYQTKVQEVTALFSQLSRDLLSLIAWFRDNGQSEAAGILEDLQLQEKEKLQLVIRCVCQERNSECVFLYRQSSISSRS